MSRRNIYVSITKEVTYILLSFFPFTTGWKHASSMKTKDNILSDNIPLWVNNSYPPIWLPTRVKERNINFVLFETLYFRLYLLSLYPIIGKIGSQKWDIIIIKIKIYDISLAHYEAVRTMLRLERCDPCYGA